MIRKIALLIFIVIVALSIVPAQAGLFKDNRLDKAKELITIQRNKEAHAILDKLILDNPKNPSIHYQAGLVYASIGWTKHVDTCFDNVYRVGPNKYMAEVGVYYNNLAYLSLQQGRTNQATNNFKRSFFFMPDVRSKTVQELFTIGQDYARVQIFGNAYNSFKVAYSLDKSLGDKISDIYFDACNQVSKPCFNFYRRANEFSHKNDRAIIEILCALYKTKGISKKHRIEIKAEIKYYASEEEFAMRFPPPPPDHKLYLPGPPYAFSLKAGEKTDHWITFPNNQKIRYSINSADYNYRLLYDDGSVLKDGQNVRYPTKHPAKFKIEAISDQPDIKMTVKIKS